MQMQMQMHHHGRGIRNDGRVGFATALGDGGGGVPSLSLDKGVAEAGPGSCVGRWAGCCLWCRHRAAYRPSAARAPHAAGIIIGFCSTRYDG
mmetsp:Transcript_64350/g.143777  ORF Transcript_64350/g.143777 Transcript_64350/m.143777 type:complete len:92 (+) Transcript_64350:2-277(+)